LLLYYHLFRGIRHRCSNPDFRLFFANVISSSAGPTPGSKLNDRYGSLLNNFISGTPGAPHRQLAVNFGTGGKCRNKAANPANAANNQSILGATALTCT
jgi:hypothetical protein